MASLRIQIQDRTIYEGGMIAVPRAGDDIQHDDQIVRVEAVVWDFRATDDVVSVTLVVGAQPYTF
jgi:hypothetical protein